MNEAEFDFLTRKFFSIPFDEKQNKVLSLKEAISKFVRPSMVLHIATTHNRPGALIYELIRQYIGKKPNFTISTLGIVSNAIPLVHTGVAKKFITTFAGDSYPTPGPNPVIQRAVETGEIEIENWSILSFPLRLLAGAMGIPYLPTHSLLGSTMEEENREWFKTIKDEEGRDLGLIKGFRADLCFMHALAADIYGNAILCPPYGEGVYSAYSAKEGVILSVDKIVPTDFIRRYSHMVKVPGYLVKAVVEVPFGAHPAGLSNRGVPEVDSYADDYDFIEELRLASKTKEKMDEWIKYWILDCDGWEDYLKKLGKPRLWALKGKADGDSWKPELLELWDKIDFSASYTPSEMMVVAGARKVSERVKKNGYKTILAGVGASNLSAWLGHYYLKEENIECELMAEIGFYGYLPRPADPFVFNFRNLPTCKMLTGIDTIMGMFMGGISSQCIGVIGAGEIDKFGNVNSTRIGKSYLVGSGGANDICSSAKEVLVVALQDRYRFVEKVAYITSPGKNVKNVVSDLGVYEKRGEELVLVAFHLNKPEKEAIEDIKAQCGWKLKVADELTKISAPTQEELYLIRMFDPKRQFLEKR